MGVRERPIRTNTVLSLIIVVAIMVGISRPAEASSPGFYNDVAAAIDSAEGNLLLYMNEGYWQLQYSGQTVRWRNDPDTIAQVQFNYQSGFLFPKSAPPGEAGDGVAGRTAATLTFAPPIHVQVLGSKPFCARVKSLTYNQWGNVIDSKMDFDNALCRTANQGTLLQMLALSRQPRALLTGNPLPHVQKVTKCSPQWSNCQPGQPLFSRVSFERSGPIVPGLLVTLKDQALLRFSQQTAPNGFDNWIKVTGASHVEFDEIDYQIAEQHLHAELKDFDLAVQSGTLQSRDVLLNLTAGSRIHFNLVTLTREGSGDVAVDGTFGSLTAGVSANSRINLNSGLSNQSYIVFDDGSDLNWQGFTLNIQADGSNQFSIGGGSTIKANVRGGHLGWNQDGFVSIVSGRVESVLRGDWSSSDRPDIDLLISGLDVVLDGGSVRLNEASKVQISAGTIKGDKLEFRGATSPSLVGKFKSLSFDIAQDSSFGVPDGIQITTDNGGKIVAADPTFPLELKENVSFPIGRLALRLPFKRMINARVASFSVTNGNVNFSLQNSEDGTINTVPGTDCTFKGRIIFESQGADLVADVNAYGGTITRKPMRAPSFVTKLKLTVLPPFSLAIVTPKGHN